MYLPLYCAMLPALFLSSHLASPTLCCHFSTLLVLLHAHPEYFLLWEGFWVWPVSCLVVLKLFHLACSHKMSFDFSVPGLSLVLP
jgi:hypothetical protein